MPGMEIWPALPYEEWAPTKKTLHMCAQMLGKTRLALSPAQPEWLHSCLYLSPRGFSTGPMPDGSRTVAMGIDLFEPAFWLRASDGRAASVPLAAAHSVAEIWSRFNHALDGLDLHLDMWEKPQEVADLRPFSENTDDCVIVSGHAQRFHSVLSAVNGVFEEFRSEFFGRTGVQFWWGSFDLAVLLFSGRKLTAPEDRGYIMRHDLDAEHVNAGFWPGDDTSPHAGFYGYLVPQPPDCAAAPVEPQYAGWVEAMGEWMMPYEAVQSCPDPRGALLDFLHSIYRVALTQGGWDGPAFEYTRPSPPARG
jgi:hypothetical protein